MKRSYLMISLILMLSFVLASCASPAATAAPTSAPVEKLVTVEVPKEVVVTEQVVVTQMVEITAQPVDKKVVEFWTTDNEEARVNAYEKVAADFMKDHPNMDVRIVPIEEAGISQRIATAVAANRLPDIVRAGVERIPAFAADGILDEAAAQAVIKSSGKMTSAAAC